MAAWLYQPVMFESSREFNCEGFKPDQCEYYKQRWHNWYVADLTFALPTVAFFMCAIGIFIVGQVLTQSLPLSRRQGPPIWRRALAATRYLSYRGFHIKTFGWNSAPVGVLLLGAVGSAYFFCMDLVPSPYYWPGSSMVWGNSPPLGTRSGWLSLACMPFIFATATKTNWITMMTGVSHEKLQVFHRWISYAFFVLALMHTFPFIVWHIANHDMVYQFSVSSTFFYWTGIVALVIQAWLTFASWSPIRNLGYEFFKAAHFISAVLFMVIFFWHCAGTLTSWHYFVATAAVYVPCWAYPWLRTLFEYGLGQKAQLFVEDNGFIRITIPAKFNWLPGQHCFLRFRSFGIHALSSHPFTICSLPSTSPQKPSEVTFYIRHRGGFTKMLYEHAMANPGVRVPVLVDGPYGGIDNRKYFSSDRLVVVAGGSGAGWILPFVEQFLRRSSFMAGQETFTDAEETHEDKEFPDEPKLERGPDRPRSMRVILATRDVATRTWFHAALNTLLSDYNAVDAGPDLRVEVHVTGEAKSILRPGSDSSLDRERSTSPSSEGAVAKSGAREQTIFDTTNISQKDVRNRPNLPLVIQEEALEWAGSGENVGVFVCGPITMQDDVRNAVAKENLGILKNPKRGGIYLHLEHFSWA